MKLSNFISIFLQMIACDWIHLIGIIKSYQFPLVKHWKKRKKNFVVWIDSMSVVWIGIVVMAVRQENGQNWRVGQADSGYHFRDLLLLKRKKKTNFANVAPKWKKTHY